MKSFINERLDSNFDKNLNVEKKLKSPVTILRKRKSLSSIKLIKKVDISNDKRVSTIKVPTEALI